MAIAVPRSARDDMKSRDLYLRLLRDSLLDQLQAPNERVAEGKDWHPEAVGRALTMIGSARLDNIQACLDQALTDGVAGDVMETGVWRGGAAIFMKGLLASRGEDSRKVILADSFEGLPPPNPDYPVDSESTFHLAELNSMNTLNEVSAAFARYGLLDANVRFVEGWFKDTLPNVDVGPLALLRLDGDMYEATMIALESLYFKITPGGYLLIDDYPLIGNCRLAVEDFRERHGITTSIELVADSVTGAYWRVD